MTRAKRKGVRKSGLSRRRSSSGFSSRITIILAVAIIVPLVLTLVLTGQSSAPEPTSATSLASVVPTARVVAPTLPPTSASIPSVTPTGATSTSPIASPTGRTPSATLAPQGTGTLTPSPTISLGVTAAPSALPATSTPRALLPTATVVPIATQAGRGDVARKLVAVDPGHGGKYSGAVNNELNVVEKDVNLRVGLAIAAKLRAKGYEVVLTRSTDTVLNVDDRDLNGDGDVTVEDDLQARVDKINAAGADLVLSLHHNGSESPMRGTMSIYCVDRPFGAKNVKLAQLLQNALLTRLRETGYSPVDLGIRDDSTIGRPHGHLNLLGPTMPVLARAASMPGVVGEPLFVSDATEAALLRQEATIEAEANAYVDAVIAYFAAYPSSGSP